MSNTINDCITVIEQQLDIELDELEKDAFCQWINNLITCRGGHL